MTATPRRGPRANGKCTARNTLAVRTVTRIYADRLGCDFVADRSTHTSACQWQLHGCLDLFVGWSLSGHECGRHCAGRITSSPAARSPLTRCSAQTPTLPECTDALMELDYILEDQVAALANATDDEKAEAEASATKPPKWPRDPSGAADG